MPSERRPSHVADILLKGNLVCSPTTVQAFHFKLDQARRRCDPYLVFCLQAAVQHSDQMPSLSLSDRIAHLLGSTAFLRREEAPTLLLICPQLTLFLFFYFHHCMQTHGTFSSPAEAHDEFNQERPHPCMRLRLSTQGRHKDLILRCTMARADSSSTLGMALLGRIRPKTPTRPNGGNSTSSSPPTQPKANLDSQQSSPQIVPNCSQARERSCRTREPHLARWSASPVPLDISSPRESRRWSRCASLEVNGTTTTYRTALKRTVAPCLRSTTDLP